MGRVFDEMWDFFEADGWSPVRLEDDAGTPRDWLRAGFKGEQSQWQVFGQAREDEEQFVCYSSLDLRVPEDRRLAVAEFIARANYGMIIGNFELDFSDGEVRYKTSVDVEGVQLSHALAKGVVYPNVLTVDRYVKGIYGVAFGGLAPVEALADIEA